MSKQNVTPEKGAKKLPMRMTILVKNRLGSRSSGKSASSTSTEDLIKISERGGRYGQKARNELTKRSL